MNLADLTDLQWGAASLAILVGAYGVICGGFWLLFRKDLRP